MMTLCCKLVSALEGRTLATAESITAGGIGAAITQVPGSSRVYVGGIISYTDAVKHLQLDVPRQLLEQLHEAFRREEQLLFVGSWAQGDVTTVYFDYRAGSLPVQLESGHAAWCQFRDGVLQEVGIYPRSYAKAAEAAALLPEMQASAAAGSILPGSEARLVYPDPGGESLSPVWSVRG